MLLLGPFAEFEAVCRIHLEIELDLGRLNSRGNKLLLAALCTQSGSLSEPPWGSNKAFCLFRCAGGTLFFREERKGGYSIHCPAVHFSQDKPCVDAAPGLSRPCLRGCRLWLGLDTWIPSLIPVLWRVRKCLCASSRGCGGGSFSGIGSTSISPCRQCNVQPFLLCESKLFFG